MKKVRGIDMDNIVELTLRWARHMHKDFDKWEINELHNEAFLIAMKLLKAGRFDPTKASLNTFLWHALPMDVRHRYRRMHGERYITNEEGKRKYKQVEFVDNTHSELLESGYDGRLVTIEVKASSDWLQARISGYTPRQLQKRGMSYQDQKTAAEEFRNEQQTEGRKG